MENSEEEEPPGLSALVQHGRMKLNTSDIKCKLLLKNLTIEVEQESTSSPTSKEDTTSFLRILLTIGKTLLYG